MRKLVTGSKKSYEDIAGRESEWQNECDETHHPAHRVVREDDRIR
jgi:hypothetical protein